MSKGKPVPPKPTPTMLALDPAAEDAPEIHEGRRYRVTMLKEYSVRDDEEGKSVTIPQGTVYEGQAVNIDPKPGGFAIIRDDGNSAIFFRGDPGIRIEPL